MEAHMTVQSKPATGSIWKHLKTGGVYIVTGACQFEVSNRPGVLYVAVTVAMDGPQWARDREEFLDGRFELVRE
jgi:hypothetical protein